MTKHPEPDDPRDWSPATSEPGEVYTPEGQIKSVGAFARGLANDDPRAKKYRRSMMRPGFYVLALAVAFVAAVVLLTALF